MSPESFVYWLQGYFELSGSAELTMTQVQTIKNHLNMVFIHNIDPKAGGPDKQALLNQAHGNHPHPPGPTGTMRC